MKKQIYDNRFLIIKNTNKKTWSSICKALKEKNQTRILYSVKYPEETKAK